MKKILLIILLFSINSFAQINTTVLFPLDIGNYWEYGGAIGTQTIHYYHKVIGEETMPNGKTYKKLLTFDFTNKKISHTYYRVEDNLRVFLYRRKVERKIFDFTLSQGKVWKESDGDYGYGRVEWKRMKYSPLVNDTLLTIRKQYCRIDSSRTPPDTSAILDVPSIEFTKGIGITLYGTVKLTGFIIKGKKYGYVPIEEDNEPTIDNDYKIEISVYPNPFNNATNIVFNNPKEQKVKISVINLLGEEITKIAEQKIKKGEQKIYLKMPVNVAAGTYFILLKTKNKQYTKKIIYLK